MSAPVCEEAVALATCDVNARARAGLIQNRIDAIRSCVMRQFVKSLSDMDMSRYRPR